MPHPIHAQTTDHKEEGRKKEEGGKEEKKVGAERLLAPTIPTNDATWAVVTMQHAGFSDAYRDRSNEP